MIAYDKNLHKQTYKLPKLVIILQCNTFISQEIFALPIINIFIIDGLDMIDISDGFEILYPFSWV